MGNKAAAPAMQGVEPLIAVIARLEALLPRALYSLRHFYSTQNEFRSKRTGKGPWTLSHALCIEASLHAPARSKFLFVSLIARKEQLRILKRNHWSIGPGRTREDAYTVSVAIQSMTKLINVLGEQKRKPRYASRVVTGFKVIEKEIKRLVRARTQPSWNHPMFLYRLRRSLDVIEKEWRDFLLPDQRDRLPKLIGTLSNHIENRLYYVAAMCSAIPDNEDDALSLGYLVHSLDTFGEFPNDVIISNGIRLAIGTLFRPDHAPRMQTILRNDEKGINISASPIELLTLLSRSRIVRSKFPDFSDFYQFTFDWLCATQRDHKGAPIWMAEPWRGVDKPEAWINAHVIEFLSAYLDLLKAACSSAIKADLRASTSQPSVSWNDLADSGGWKHQLQNEFLKPIEDDLKGRKPLQKRSVLLYGPPGTSKTSIARAIAWRLKWPFISISPNQFLEDGMEGVVRSARKIFERLMVLNHCVVLFDELDEMVERRDPDHEKISRFITTSVLPWFQDLRDKSDIVFLATTNSISHFDRAVKRPGRFDFVLPVGPPKAAGRKTIFAVFLEKEEFKPKEISKLVPLVMDCVKGQRVKGKITQQDADGKTVDKKIGYSWDPTVGEIKIIVEIMATKRKAKSKPLSASDIGVIVSKIAKNPQISAATLHEFKQEMTEYRFPPL